MCRVGRVVFAVAGFTILPAVWAHSDAPISVRVRNHIANAPATVDLVVSVAPDAQNRQVLVQADSGEYLRSSVIELDGHSDAVQQLIEFRGMPAGRYDVTATLSGDHGVRAIASDVLTVLDAH